MSKKHDDNQDDNQSLPSDDGQNLTPQTESQDMDQLKKELDDVKSLASQMENQLKRAVADYQNLEKRIAEGKQEFSEWANAELLRKLMPIINNFDQVIKGAGEDEKRSGWFKGVEMSVKQLQDTLRSEGLDEIEADGQFDPSLHEAVDTREGEHDKIVDVVQKGYTLNGKVLQPAKVVVGRKS